MQFILRKGIFSEDIHRKIYIFLLFAILVSIPLSRIVLSIAQITLALNWILSGNFVLKFDIIKKNKDILLLPGIYIVDILWMINTSDTNTGLEDIKLKLPFLAFPLIIGTSYFLTRKNFIFLISVFSISVFVKLLISTYFFLTQESVNISETVHELSYIRLSVMTVMSIFFLIYYACYGKLKLKSKIVFIFSALILSFFVFFLKSFTGIILWLSFVMYIFLNTALKSEKKIKIILLSIQAVFFLSITTYIAFTLIKYNKIEKNTLNIEVLSKSGNKYTHLTHRKDRENGNYVFVNICDIELETEWNKISNYKYSGFDKKEQEIKYTLIRYLTSKGLTKDKEGINSLSKEDIINIENGMSNYIFADKLSLYPKLYTLYWQIEQYRNGANPAGHSVTQRIEFVKNGIRIISKNFWFGVGTGDLETEYSEYYELSNSKLPAKYRLKPHNQYITYLVCFGIFGFLYIMFAFFYPVVIRKKYKDFKFIIVFISMLVSMLNEDALEVQIGITFFALFYSLIMWNKTDLSNTVLEA